MSAHDRLHDDLDPDLVRPDLVRPDQGGEEDLLTRLRPPPGRTWRDRLDDLLAAPPPWGRLAVGIAVVAVAAVLAVRVLAPPTEPAEGDLPLARPTAPGATAPGGAVGGAPMEAATDGLAPATDPPAYAGGGAGGGDAGVDASGASAATTEVVVHVVGAVAAPGVQRLPAGTRVVDAVAAAGGATADADLARVNLAAVLTDGQQIVILRPGEQPPAGVAATPGGGGGPVDPASGAVLVDLNTATATELEALPGVGPATAEAILSHRQQHGPFASVDDLLDVRGIGEAKLEQLRAHATV